MYRETALKIGNLLLCLILGVAGLNAQDRTLSFYQENPILGNPARYTSYDSVQVGFHARYQPLGNEQFLSTLLLDASLPILQAPDSSYRASFILGFLYDQQGVAFKTQGLMSGIAYRFGNNRLQLSLGVQGGIFWEQLSSTDFSTRANFSFPDGFDPVATNAETALGNRGSYTSLSTGIRLRKGLRNGREKFYVGLALRNANHLGREQNLEEGTQIVLPSHINVSAGYRFFPFRYVSPVVHSRWTRRWARGEDFDYVQSGVFVDIRPHSPYNLGRSFRTGLWYNTNNALGAQFQLNFPTYTFRFSYELGLSTRERVWLGNGAFEFGLGIRLRNIRRKKIREPVLPPLPVYRKSYTYLEQLKPEDLILPPNTLEIQVPSIRISGPTYTVDRESIQVLFTPVNLSYDIGEISLADEARQKITPLIQQLKVYYGSKILITGYTCNLGDPTSNRELSLKRAYVVKDYMVSQGVNPNNIRVVGLGESRPLNQNVTELDRKINRRVIIEPDSQ